MGTFSNGVEQDDGSRGRAIHDRFEALMSFVKNHEGRVPFRSGNNEGETPGNLLNGLEDQYDEKTSFDSESALVCTIMMPTG